jgi:RNA polymerase sigma factor (sigma-70 family)
MTKEKVITQENFEVLLGWLDRNRDDAGQKYEKIRRRLIRIFVGRGCFEAEELADETINRVTQKVPQIAGAYVGDPVLYFHSVANKIYLEWLRKQKKLSQLPPVQPDNHAEPESETEYQCLEMCLQTLPASQRQLIVEYYGKEKSAKIENRRTLAEKLEISVSALQVKAFRIRVRLKECVQKCVAETA